jgi:RNA polymerase sigma-70 factor (ECF subfamily)
LLSDTAHTEKNLLLLIAKGNELAFRQLFDTYNKKLFTFAEGMLKSAADAEEVVQESFTKVWLNKEALTDVENPGGYLYAIVRNATLDHMRKTSRDQKLIEQVFANISDLDNSLEEELQKKESQQLIEQAVSQLSETKQAVYRLSREQEYSHEQIAELTGLSKSRVNNILVETLKHIKTHLEKHSGRLAIAFWICTWNKLM